MFKIGDTVDYHEIIGGPVTSEDHVIRDIDRAPNNYDCDVAWLTSKRGCVALRALSHTPPGPSHYALN